MNLKTLAYISGYVRVPWHRAVSQSLLYVHVITLEIHNDDVEVLVFGLVVQELHVTDELLDPASLVLHCRDG